MKTHIIFITVFVIMAIATNGARAEWGPSVPVTELNTQYLDASPFISHDGLTMYFGRDTGSGYRMYQATRSAPSGQFTQISEITTLNNGGHILVPWVSEDNLRMYYHKNIGSDKMYYTSRTSVTAPWMPGTQVSEIDVMGNVCSMTLSSDECTAVFSVDNYPTWLTYTATRPNKNSPFSNIVPITALNTSYSADAFLTPDALAIYFVSDLGGQLYKASRATTSDVFGNVTFIPGFEHIRFPSLTADGKTMYWQKQYYDQNNHLISDIYVSQFVPEPATMVLLGLGAFMLRRKK